MPRAVTSSLSGLAVEGVHPVPAAVLLHLDALTVVLLVLDRDVVAALALLAGQRDLHSLLVLRHDGSLLDDLGDAAGADGAAALTNGEPQALVHGDGLVELHGHGGVVARHHHLGPLRKRDAARHIRRPEVELGTVVV